MTLKKLFAARSLLLLFAVSPAFFAAHSQETKLPAPVDIALLPEAPAQGDQQQGSTPPPANAAPNGSANNGNAAANTAGSGKQTKRVLYIVPNFRSVSADQKLPPQTFKDKFLTATQDSLDYSSFIFVGIQAGAAMAHKQTPQFRQGAAGYGRYYWHTLADTIDENTWVEFLLPVAFHQDSRFYTLGRGSFPHRLYYSFSRAFITRTDNGTPTFNASEIMGSGAAAGISGLYYPSGERGFTKTYQRWITNLSIDTGVFVFREFWPTLNDKFFHQTD
jgi:hypothetical protein